MTAASLHRAFRLQPRGLSRRATVANCLPVLHPIGVRRLSSDSTATYPEPRGRASTRERDQGITRGGVAPLRITSLESTRGRTFPNSRRLPASASTLSVTCYLRWLPWRPSQGTKDELSLDAVEKIPAGRCSRCCCPRWRLDHPGRRATTRPQHHHRTGQYAHSRPGTRLTRPRLCATAADPRTADSHPRPGHLGAPDHHPTSAGASCPQTAQTKNSAVSTSRPAASTAVGTGVTTDHSRHIRSCG